MFFVFAFGEFLVNFLDVVFCEVEAGFHCLTGHRTLRRWTL